MVCAQCHDHPFERWTQSQYYQMAAFFSAVGLRAGYEVGEEIVFDQRSDYEMKNPKGREVKPQFMVALNGALPIPGDQRRRDALAQWLTSKDNPFFARAQANRVWHHLLGHGLVLGAAFVDHEAPRSAVTLADRSVDGSGDPEKSAALPDSTKASRAWSATPERLSSNVNPCSYR